MVQISPSILEKIEHSETTRAVPKREGTALYILTALTRIYTLRGHCITRHSLRYFRKYVVLSGDFAEILSLGSSSIISFVRIGKLYLPQIAIFVLDKEDIKLWV